MCLFRRLRKPPKDRNKAKVLEAVVNLRHYEIAEESIALIKTTLNPRTFFGRCSDVAAAEERITGKPSKFLNDTMLQTALQMDFVDRMVAAGRRETLREAMQPYVDRLTPEARLYYDSVLTQL